jgi:hypothetical protein
LDVNRETARSAERDPWWVLDEASELRGRDRILALLLIAPFVVVPILLFPDRMTLSVFVSVLLYFGVLIAVFQLRLNLTARYRKKS